MAPANFACLVVDRFDDALAPESIVRAGPAISAVGGLGKVEGVTVARGNYKQSILRVETWGAEVGQAAFIGCDQASVRRRFFVRIRNRAPLLIDAQRPVHRAERRGVDRCFTARLLDSKAEVNVTRYYPSEQLRFELNNLLRKQHDVFESRMLGTASE